MQTGKLFQVKVTLSRVDEECMTLDDLAEGSQLLMMNNKKSYPVSVQKIISALSDATTERKCNVHVLTMQYLNLITENGKSGSKNPRKCPAPSKTNSKPKRPKVLDKENLHAAKLEVCTLNRLLATLKIVYSFVTKYFSILAYSRSTATSYRGNISSQLYISNSASFWISNFKYRKDGQSKYIRNTISARYTSPVYVYLDAMGIYISMFWYHVLSFV